MKCVWNKVQVQLLASAGVLGAGCLCRCWLAVPSWGSEPWALSSAELQAPGTGVHGEFVFWQQAGRIWEGPHCMLPRSCGLLTLPPVSTPCCYWYCSLGLDEPEPDPAEWILHC